MITLRLSGSVGLNGKNAGPDVHLIQALLNAYRRHSGGATIACDGKISQDCTDLIGVFQQKIQKTAKPDSLVGVGGATFKELVAYLKGCFTKASIVAPAAGELTWKAEGAEQGPFHSRRFHVPSVFSGLTIGRGYDMKEKSAGTIVSDLSTAGLDAPTAQKIGKAARLKGPTAERFVIENDLLDFEISASVQLALFKKTYEFHLADMKLVSAGPIAVKEHGRVDWSKVPQTVLDILVDLRYRGDFTPASRKKFQAHVVNGEYEKFKKVIQDKSNWPTVPADRFELRSSYANAIR
jgi:hypothetical protein